MTECVYFTKCGLHISHSWGITTKGKTQGFFSRYCDVASVNWSTSHHPSGILLSHLVFRVLYRKELLKMSNLYLFNLVFYQASIGHVQLRGKVQERKQDFVGLQGDDTSENQQQEISLRIPTVLRSLLIISHSLPPHVVSQLCCSK